MTVLVVGASGQLGTEVCARAVAAGERVVGTYHRAPGGVDGVDWRRLDVRDRSGVDALVAGVRPRVVVGTAYVAGDWATTADGAAHVARAAAGAGARLVHISSDALHGGRPEPYGDDEPPSPGYPYGAAKAAAETAVRLVDPAAAIVRTSLILGDEHSKQIRLCLDALAGSATLFRDEVRCPIGVEDLAAAVLELTGFDYSGTINVAGPEAVSREQLGLLVARRFGVDPSGLRTTTIAEAGLIRPTEIRLDSSRAAGLLKTRLRGVSELLPA